MQMSRLGGRSRGSLVLITAGEEKEKRAGQPERDKRVAIGLLRLLDVEAGLPLASFATYEFESCYFGEWSFWPQQAIAALPLQPKCAAETACLPADAPD